MPIIQIDKDLEDILPDFLRHREDDIKILRESIKSQDFNKTKTIGHRLSGTAPGYGFMDLGSIGEQIEKYSKEEDLAQIIALTEQYEDYLKNIEIEFI